MSLGSTSGVTNMPQKAIFIPEHEEKIPERQLVLNMAAVSLDSGAMSVTFNAGQTRFELTEEQLKRVTDLVCEILLEQEGFKMAQVQEIPDEVLQEDETASKEQSS